MSLSLWTSKAGIVKMTATWPTTFRAFDLGVIGVNFEDRIVKGSGLYDIDRQARRVAVIRKAAENKGVALFINARTDLFLGQSRDAAQSVGEALERAKAYVAAGASGFFIPGLRDDALIGRICDGVAVPVNVMVMDGVPSAGRLAELGVSRISYGPIPYIRAMEALQQEARNVLSWTKDGPRPQANYPRS